MMLAFPPQRIPYTAKDKAWREMTFNYLCSEADVFYTENYARMFENYQLHNNKIDQKELQRYCDPLGYDAGQGTDFIQCFNKTPNKIQILKGEELKRPWAYHVLDLAPNATSEATREKERLLKEYFDSQIGAEIQRQQAQMQMKAQMQIQSLPKNQAQRAYQQVLEQLAAKEKEILNPEQIEKKFKNYKTIKERMIAKLMKIRVQELKLRHLKNEAFFDATVAGMEAIMVHVVNGEPIAEVLNTLGCAWYKSPEEEFFQNGDFFVYKREMSIGQIYDLFGADLADKDITRIEERLTSMFGLDAKLFSRDGFSPSHFEHRSNLRNVYGNSGIAHEGTYGQSQSNESYEVVYTGFWKSYTEIAFLYSNDGKENYTIVPSEFPVPDYAEKNAKKEMFGKSKTTYSWTDKVTGVEYALFYEYIPQIWQGTRIGQDIYTKIEPYEYGRVNLQNPFKTKLPVFGAAFNTRNSTIISYMDRMKPWQKLYLLLMSKFLKLIAQDKGVISLINVLMLDANIDLDKTLQYAVDVGFLPYNPLGNSEGINQIQQGMKAAEAVNLSNIANIRYYADLLRFVEDQIGDAAGISKPREGQTSSNTNVGDNRQDLIQSAVITEPIFSVHDLVWEDVLNELMYLSQRLIAENGFYYKRGILSDEEIAVIDMQGIDFNDCELALYMAQNSNANKIIDTVNANVQALIQNDKVNLSTFISMLSTQDLGEMKAEVKELEESIAAREQAMQQSQLDNQSQIAKMQIEAREDEQEFQLELQANKDVEAYKREELKVFANAALGVKDLDIDDNGVIDALELEKLRHNKEESKRKLDIEDKKVLLDEKRLKVEKELKEKEIKSKIQISRNRPKSK